MTEHAERKLQPSSFKRTMMCPGWGNFCETNNIPPNPTNIYAAEGSVAHELAATCLTKGQSPYKYVGETGWYNNGRCGIKSSDISALVDKAQHFIFTIDDAMAEAVDVYVQECLRKRKECIGAKILVEKRGDLFWLAPGMFGTADHLIIEPLGRIFVDDYKHGQGVAVDVGVNVGDNPQLAIYALGALGKGNPHMVEDVVVTIVQPRAMHIDGSIRSISFDADLLLEWGQDVLKPAVERSKDPDAPLVAGPHCQFCDAEKAVDKNGRLLCPAKRAATVESAKTMFGKEVTLSNVADLTPPDPTGLPGEKLDKILQFQSVFTSWLKAVESEAFARLENGSADAPTQFKLVAGNMSNRAWADENAVYGAVKTILPRKDVYVEKVKSPAQLETALRKAGHKGKAATELTEPLLKERVAGKAVMVPIDSPKPALPPKAERMFEANEKKEK